MQDDGEHGGGLAQADGGAGGTAVEGAALVGDEQRGRVQGQRGAQDGADRGVVVLVVQCRGLLAEEAVAVVEEEETSAGVGVAAEVGFEGREAAEQGADLELAAREAFGGGNGEAQGDDGAVVEAGAGEGGGVGGEDGAEAAEMVDQAFGERLGVAFLDAQEEEHLDDLVVGQRLAAVGEEALAHAAAVAGGAGGGEDGRVHDDTIPECPGVSKRDRRGSAGVGGATLAMEGDMAGLDGAAALVTGASSGIGFGVAEELAGRGAKVAINYHSHPEPAEQLAGKIRAAGGEAIAVGADVSDEGEVARLFDETVAAFGRVDVLVANSGMQKDAPVAEMTVADWRAVIDVNLTGQFLCCREAIRRFRGQDKEGRPFRAAGSIVSMSSVHDRIPWAGHVNYAASKGGIRMMVETLAQEVAADGIRVNAVAPGAIRTPINKEAWGTEEALGKLLALIPYGRIGEPEDVAKAVAWLLSDEADYVTGTTMYVDGGMVLYPEFRAGG